MRKRLLMLLALAHLFACASARQPAPQESAAPTQVPVPVRYLSGESGGSGLRAVVFWRRLGERNPGQPVNLLAISGGGVDGAFAAGALVGLAERGARVDYDVVTGVSTGALLAPFALLGRDEPLTALYAAGRGRHLLRLSWRGHAGLYSARPLQTLIDHTYDDQLIDAVAAAGEQGRSLLVATTNLDDETPVIWDLTALAALRTPAARSLFRQVLLASASYPPLLPPVLIDVDTAAGGRQEMHVDGGTTLPLFLGPGVDSLDPDAVEALPRLHAYVLVNRQLNAAPRSVDARLLPVLQRALVTQTRRATRAALIDASAFLAHRGASLEVADISAQQTIPRPFDFGNPAVQSLFASAERRALQGTLWQSAEQAMNPGPRASVVASDD